MKQLKMAVDVVLGFLDEEGEVIDSENSITDLIFHNGARVLSYRQVPAGEFLILKTADGQFESPAIVKAVQLGADNIPRLHLEFTGHDWQGKWLYQEQESPELYYEELNQSAKEAALLLQIVIEETTNGQQPDLLFLDELQGVIDKLRSVIYQIRKSTQP